MFRGHSDPPLTSVGWDSSRTCVKSLPRTFNQIVSSDLQRCRAFAEEWSRDIQVPLQVEPRLREISFGAWEDLTPEEVQSRFPREFADFRVAPESWAGAGGENFMEFRGRVMSALNQLRAGEPNRHVALVTHAGVIRLIMAMSLRISYLSALQLVVEYASAREVWYEPSPPPLNEITKIL